jgi:DNA transformation protein
MPARSQFVEFLIDQLQPLGGVSARAMFGGWGVYLDGRMFALVAEDTLYIKADDANRAEFTAFGLESFRFEMKGAVKEMSYFQPPASALDDGVRLCAWARKGVEAAARAAQRKKPAARKRG